MHLSLRLSLVMTVVLFSCGPMSQGNDDGGTSGVGGGSSATGGGTSGGGGGTSGGGGGASGGGGATGGGSSGGGTGGGGGATGGGSSSGGGSGACTPGVECRARAGDCDLPEVCDANGQCPADGLVGVGVVCRAPAGPCDLDERCNGTSAACPADTLAPTTTVCRSAAGGCDLEERCSGNAPQCPADTRAPSTTVCRPVAGSCDVEERCDGSDAQCPADGFVQVGMTCRAALGGCDLPEACTGSGAMCPPDLLVSAGMTCRAAVNVCDLPETCSGSSVNCPTDAFQGPSFECAAQSCTSGVTTPARLCAGSSATCNTVTPVSCNGYQCGGTTCRTTCVTSNDCLSTHFCQPGNQCAPRRIDGQACTGPANGFECVSGTCVGSYVDGDGDGFGTGTIGFFCGAAAPTGRALNAMDCCDSDNRARPNQTSFQTTARTGCGGFDFNCDSASTPQLTGSNACQSVGSCAAGTRDCTGDTGWTAAQPACGGSGTYVSVCNIVDACSPTNPGFICSATSSTRTQGCL